MLKAYRIRKLEEKIYVLKGIVAKLEKAEQVYQVSYYTDRKLATLETLYTLQFRLNRLKLGVTEADSYHCHVP